MAGEVRGGRRCGEGPSAEAGGQQAVGRREGRPGGPPEDPCAAVGGVPADRLQRDEREGVPEGERVQDAAGCECQASRLSRCLMLMNN